MRNFRLIGTAIDVCAWVVGAAAETPASLAANDTFQKQSLQLDEIFCDT